MITKAVILAAGRGTRVQPLTYDMPKPMIPLLGRPVMEYLVDHLARQGIKEIMVNVSHLAHRIEQYFGDGRRFGVRIGYSYEGHMENNALVPVPVGSAGALRKINDFGGFIDSTTLVLCGDAVIDLDIRAAAAKHAEDGALATVITREVPKSEVSNYGIVVAAPDGRVVSFQEKPSPDEALSRQASTGIYIIEPGVLNLIPQGRNYDIGGELFPDLVRRCLPFYTQCHEFEWLDIGRVSDYWHVTQRLLSGGVPGIGMPGTPVKDNIHVGLNTQVAWESVWIQGPVYIGSGACIEAGAVIRGPAWIGDGCKIGAGAEIDRSVLFDYTEVGTNAIARELILSGRYCVFRDGQPAESVDVHDSWKWWRDARQLNWLADGRN